MNDFDTSLGEYPTDEQMTVTLGRVALAAKHRDAVRCASFEETCEAALKDLGVGESVIANMAFLVVERCSVGSPAEFFTEKHVPNSMGQ